ncbi:Ribosomal protein S5 2-like protein [Glarea lozoyensis ATCC 20868]|uniref:Ribosomal protein S5 2-like protein n=1 Tax=Glarea lozoyensis (strain ATCC 20868 / MF5171) TaxID=1116229 RepID=S3CL28_GLAL2|nr:Ribosomal protein S5 2-like protein [Glarea lozoyensis ATCC 20868]EPE25924.1 Ribosomal protein S5 2-like protein [Glarea lozoyensis ATCC 20868]
MAMSTEPSASLSHLHSADGSATFSQNGYTVIGAVNGPIEVQRRDELPEEAAVDIVVRPAAGVGGTRERHLESILQSTLRQIILTHNFPRTLIQITLQITKTPKNEAAASKVVQASSHLAVLPVLLQTALLTLLSASLPLSMVLTSTLIAISADDNSASLIQNPNLTEYENAKSIHVLAFTSQGDLLLAESQGSFDLKDWDKVYETAKKVCLSTQDDADMQGGASLEEKTGSMLGFVKSVMEEKVAQDLHWHR